MKKLVSLLLAFTMVFSLAACGGTQAPPAQPAPAAPAAPAAEPAAPAAPAAEPAAPAEPAPAAPEEPKVTLTYAEVNPEDSLMGMTANEFKKKVEELTNGSVTINIQFGGVLGAEGDVLDTMIGGGGTVDLARISAFSMTSYGTKRSSLLSMPYTFTGREHFWKYANSDMATGILMEPHDIGLGVRGLFYLEEGFRHFFFRSPVNSIGDVAGTKIRVSTDPVMTGMVEGLGASPTVVAFGELYQALSSGVVDGAEQPIVNYQSNAFHEVAPYMILDGHTLGAAQVIMTDAAWDKLSPSQQEAVVEAGKVASAFNGSKSAEIEEKCVAELEAAGVTFVPVSDLKPWQDACATVVSENIVGMEDDYNKILSVQ